MLGGRLRKLRRDRGLSLAFVSAACGLSRTHLDEIELERRPPPRPSHPAYAPLGELLGIPCKRLQRAARLERRIFVEGVSWSKHLRSTR